MNCGNCGNPLEAGATFCNKCGTPVAQEKPKKGGSKIIIFILLLLVFLGIGIGVGYAIGKGKETKCKTEAKELKKDDKEKEEKEEKPEEKKEEEKEDTPKEKKPIDINKLTVKYENDFAENIVIEKTYYDENREYLYILGKNTGTENADYTIYLNYTDEQGKRVDRNISSGYVESGKYFVTYLWNKSDEEYKDYNLSITGSTYKSYFHKVNLDKKKLSIEKTDSGIRVSYKNDTKQEFSIMLAIIYYKNGEIVYFDKGTLIGVKPGLTDDTTFSVYNLPGYDYSKKDTSEFYDKYEVIISSAYYYDKDY